MEILKEEPAPHVNWGLCAPQCPEDCTFRTDGHCRVKTGKVIWRGFCGFYGTSPKEEEADQMGLGKTYTEEFKATAVQRLKYVSAHKLSQELGVHPSLLSKWRREREGKKPRRETKRPEPETKPDLPETIEGKPETKSVAPETIDKSKEVPRGIVAEWTEELHEQLKKRDEENQILRQAITERDALIVEALLFLVKQRG